MMTNNTLTPELAGLKQIILVDDNREEYELLKVVFDLQLPNVRIDWLCEGDRLAGFLARHSPRRPASTLVLLDINMPGKGAGEILAELAEKGLLGKAPIVVMSAVEKPEDPKFYSRYPNVIFSRKPCGLEDYDRFIQSFGRVLEG